MQKLEQQVSQPDFWSDSEQAQKTIQELNALRDEIAPLAAAQGELDDLQVVIDLAEEEDDAELWAEAKMLVTALQEKVSKLEVAMLFRGRYDQQPAIIAIHPGAGGTASQDWASMLLRMYTRWAERNNFQVQFLYLMPGDEAGIIIAIQQVIGKYAYVYLNA